MSGEASNTKCPACRLETVHTMRKRTIQDRLIDLEREIREPSDFDDLDQAAQLGVFESQLAAVRRSVNEILCGMRGLCMRCRADRMVVRAMADALHAKPAAPPPPTAAAKKPCPCGHKWSDHGRGGICYARLCFGSVDGRCGQSHSQVTSGERPSRLAHAASQTPSAKPIG